MVRLSEEERSASWLNKLVGLGFFLFLGDAQIKEPSGGERPRMTVKQGFHLDPQN